MVELAIEVRGDKKWTWASGDTCKLAEEMYLPEKWNDDEIDNSPLKVTCKFEVNNDSNNNE